MVETNLYRFIEVRRMAKQISETTHHFILTTTVFLGAFLLFVSEPLIGRLLLPVWGGAVHVWLICLMFFQGMLLLGYLYAHFIAPRIGFWHLCFLVLPFINLPFRIDAELSSQPSILSLLILLLSHFALPFTVLSTTAVVVQLWMARSYLGQAVEPYPLYAASNAGSLIGLFSYPFLFEPLMGVRTQSFVWASFYVVLMILMSMTFYVLRSSQKKELTSSARGPEGTIESAPLRSTYGIWLFMSGLPSALLLTVTSFISMEIGSFPMIWILPLASYLASFIVIFRTGAKIPDLLTILWPEILLIAAAFYFVGPDNFVTILACLATFFVICILAHGKLYEHRPPVRWLTNFYLTIALGGFLGGVSVSVIAPLIFNGYLEYLILLFLLGVFFWYLRSPSFEEFWRKLSVFKMMGRVALVGIILTLLGMGTLHLFHETVRFRHRNFYGIYRIVEDLSFDKKFGDMRKLVHGKTMHGAQMLDPSVQRMPVSYYYQGGGFADVYDTAPKPFRTAVIGLGAGVICAYTEKGDAVTFYEIDPDNYEIAKRWFTYLSECKGEVKVITGDGRLSMNDTLKGESKYDIITIDAFTGSGIPIHLLTKEAIEVYLNRLAEDGIILFHISNDFYNLRPVIKSTSQALNLFGAMNPIVGRERLKKYENTSNCVAVARNPVRLRPLMGRGWTPFSEKDGLSKVSPWTDNYINILAPLIEKMKRGAVSLD
jgi:spermidine synthase